MTGEVVITGIGMVTPLGRRPEQVLARVAGGQSAARPVAFELAGCACEVLAPIEDFEAESLFPENKSLRLMNRDAAMAAVAARLALRDAGITSGTTYAAEQIGLFGATGLTSMPLDEIGPLVRRAADDTGRLDLERLGSLALKRTRPVLSFKILANMPICFVSILEAIRGPNTVYTPWEGQGAQALVAGIRAVARGDVPCAVVGGCDVKTNVMSLVGLQQCGALDAWRRHGRGPVPGEGAAFLVLEDAGRAARRAARVYARVAGFCLRAGAGRRPAAETLAAALAGLTVPAAAALVAAADGDPDLADAEHRALAAAGVNPRSELWPKVYLGNLYAAAAAVQLALAAAMAADAVGGSPVLASCFGFGGQQAAFLLEAA